MHLSVLETFHPETRPAETPQPGATPLLSQSTAQIHCSGREPATTMTISFFLFFFDDDDNISIDSIGVAGQLLRTVYL